MWLVCCYVRKQSLENVEWHWITITGCIMYAFLYLLCLLLASSLMGITDDMLLKLYDYIYCIYILAFYCLHGMPFCFILLYLMYCLAPHAYTCMLVLSLHTTHFTEVVQLPISTLCLSICWALPWLLDYCILCAFEDLVIW